MSRQRVLQFFMVSIFLLTFVSGIGIDNLPVAENRYVNDYASVLSEEQNTYLVQLFSNLEYETTGEIVFLSVNSCSPYAPSDAATKIFNEWGIGKAEKDNGLLILYCLEENKIFAATGYGLEGILPDSKVGRMLDDYYVPLRDEGNVSQGIISFSEAIYEEMLINKEEITAGAKDGNLGNIILISIIIVFFVSLVIFLIFQARKNLEPDTNTSSSRAAKENNVSDKNATKRTWVIVGGILFSFIVPNIFFNEFFSVLLFFVSLAIFVWIAFKIPRVCSIDGTTLVLWKKEGAKTYYKCAHEHVNVITSKSSSGLSSRSSTFGSSSSSGSSFGGGSSGGGGAGR